LDGDPESFERRQAVGHQAFAARFVDRHPRAVGHDDAESPLPCRNGRCQSRGTTTNYEYISRVQQLPTSPP
jgi:hypothetical protein